MLTFKEVDLNGLILRGDIPDSPRTAHFLTQHNLYVTRANGKLTFNADYSITKKDVEKFLASKKSPTTKQKL